MIQMIDGMKNPDDRKGRKEGIHRVRLAAPGVPSERPYRCAQGEAVESSLLD
ncbi:hypothetical protein [Pseudomarimonas salicorniae]|uniref:Uncharacterized protein n=1 Tax=Pseudomarimonas salicorniae TaxID=2933270 RepID=A0ABT0GH77_9GAMM|nr:hypothetical protein [Lysobacter sp. CAU 1642]MCK7593885.1 hypothetical protein [Lysobacter sp. CAU 1642]